MARPTAAPRAPTPPRLRAREDRCAARAAPQERSRVGARPDLRDSINQERFGPAPGCGLGAEPDQARLHHWNPPSSKDGFGGNRHLPRVRSHVPSDARPRVEHLAYPGVAVPLSLPPRRSRCRDTLGDAVKRPIPHLEIGRSRKGLIQAQEHLQKGATGATDGFWFISTDFSMRGYGRTGVICGLCTRLVG